MNHKKQKTFLIESYLDLNFGDSLLLEMLLRHLDKYDCYVIGDNPFTYSWITQQYPNVTILQRNRIDIKVLDLISDYILIGGSIFQHNKWYEGVFRYKTALMIWKLKRHKISTHIVNCNIGPIISKIGLSSTKLILKLSDSITCRDKDSFDFITHYARANNCSMNADLVFGIDVPARSNNNSFTLGISVYTAYIPSLVTRNLDYCNQIISIIQFYQKNKTSFNVKLFVYDSFRNNDFPNMNYIMKYCCEHSISVVPVVYCGDSQKILFEMATCNLFVGTRFHSIVLSLKMQIPCIPIIYSNKSENLIKDIQYDGSILHFGDQVDHGILEKIKYLSLSDEKINGLTQSANKHLLSF